MMLLRNLEPGAGLCNGTRLLFQRVCPSKFVLVCTIMETGRQVFIPRISLRPKDKEYAFSWSRRQFPVRVAFCSTVNKAQGDSLKSIGIWLPQPVFGHGQKYVAPSRVGSKQQCWYAIRAAVMGKPFNHTPNVVFREVLQEADSHQEEPMEEVQSSPVTAVSVTEVDDINLWADYDAIETEFDIDLELDLEELGTPQQPVEARHRVERTCPASLSCLLPEDMGPPPTAWKSVQLDRESLPPLPDVPLSQYEMIRENNIDKLNEVFLQTFGYPLNRRNSCLVRHSLIPGYEEVDKDDNIVEDTDEDAEESEESDEL